MGAANGFNMIAGYNGLETGMGAIILFTMGYIAWFTRTGWVAVVALCMFSSLVAFYLFNKYPARIFPGDTLTYSVGALIACVAIAGNMESLEFCPCLLLILLSNLLKLRENEISCSLDRRWSSLGNSVSGTDIFQIDTS